MEMHIAEYIAEYYMNLQSTNKFNIAWATVSFLYSITTLAHLHIGNV